MLQIFLLGSGMLDLYSKKITDISLDSLKNLAGLTSFPICVCGGWAVYFTINDLFKEQKNRDYIGSQDIDIGFYLAPMMTKTELENTDLFKTLDILESNGFKPEGFRYKKEIEYTQQVIKDEKLKNKEFVLYIDILVNSYPPSLYDIYPNCFFEVPLIEQVYSSIKYQVKISSVSDNLFIPTREIIAAMKVQSLPSRGDAFHKKVKDLCDLYSLLWFSKKTVKENIEDMLNFIDVNSIKRLKNSINKNIVSECEGYLGEPKGSLNTVLNDLYKYNL
jgi:hypothetical protein